MERWLEMRVWHKERPGREMSPGEERQEKTSSHLPLPPISCVAWAGPVASPSLSLSSVKRGEYYLTLKVMRIEDINSIILVIH